MVDGEALSEFSVAGTTFAPEGDITTIDGKHLEKAVANSASVQKLAQICSVCNDSKIAYNEVRNASAESSVDESLLMPHLFRRTDYTALSESRPKLP